ncbi:MAG: diacylglycerol kinase family lipid kinase [Clostridia bacterium]|nr:diacylglycerol kinase family lipid kinase [Clostridia bacterium]
MIYAICNPTAGSGRGEKIGHKIQAILDSERIPCLLRMTERPGHATELARQARDAQAETVLAIGGDGTAFEVARGLVGSDTPLGVIPAGTGNDFVKTIGVPQDPESALEYVLASEPQKTDVGEINGEMFLNEIGTGFDVSVLDYAAKAKKYCRGLLPYLYGVMQTLFRFHAVPITCSVDGGPAVTRDAFVVGVANGRWIGGGIGIAPDARADDGLLDVVIVDKISRRKLLNRLIGLMKGKILTFPETHFVRASQVAFSAPAMRVNVDGEILAMPSVQARVLPGALLVRRQGSGCSIGD